MKLRKFVAARTTEALAQIKAELGPEAVIVSIRDLPKTAQGTRVEVTAAIDRPETPAPAPAAQPEKTLSREMEELRRELRTDDSSSLRGELDELRNLILTQRADTLDAGALERCARGKTLTAPTDARVIALVGPTGAGKTTTIAKLAARAALVRAESVAIVTLDTYRVGGEQQMRIFADLIGAPLYTVRDPNKLADVVARLGNYDRIYVDTAGRSPTAETEIKLTLKALETLGEVELHLTLPADSRGSTIDRWMKIIGNDRVDRLLFTKVDEAESLAEIVLAPIRHETPVGFITTGQRVPEDIVQATDGRLLAIAGEGAQREAA
jgi:flagellar biosynthesis protein FlhF